MPQKILKIYDGRTHFCQWDQKQKITVLDDSITQVCFSIKNMKYSIPRDVYVNSDGIRVCDVPDKLLQTSGNIIAYAYSDTELVKIVKFAVMRMPKPGDYVEDAETILLDTDTKYQTVKVDDYNYKLQSKGKMDELWSDVDGSIISIPNHTEDIDALEDLVGTIKVSDQIDAAIKNKSDIGHTHNDRYYTESEIDNKLRDKSDISHTHDISGLVGISDASVKHALTADTANAVEWSGVTGKPDTYIPSKHTHVISDVQNLQLALDSKVPTTRTVNGKALSTDITLSAYDIGADASGSAASALANSKSYTDAEIAEWVGNKTVSEQISEAIDNQPAVNHKHTIADVSGLQTALDGKETSGAASSALTSAKSYTDTKISDLINSAPTTLDTLGEIAAVMEENKSVVEALDKAIGTKANASDLSKYATIEQVNKKADTNHIHEDVNTSITNLNKLVGNTNVSTQISEAIKNKADKAHTHTADEVGADTIGSADNALYVAKSYTDEKITEFVGNKPVSEQILDAMQNQDTFSGDYNDLDNTPNVFKGNDGSTIITDESGNVILKVDSNGAHATALTVNGKNIPDRLPNPNKLTFTGAVMAEYDGSEPVSVEIPAGGGASSSDWETIVDLTTTEEVTAINITSDTDGKPFELCEAVVEVAIATTNSNTNESALQLRTNVNTAAKGGSNTSALRMFRPGTSGSYSCLYKLSCRDRFIHGTVYNIGNMPDAVKGYYNENAYSALTALYFSGGTFGVGSRILVKGVRA